MLKKKEQESGGKLFRLTVNDRLSTPNKCPSFGEKCLVTAHVHISAQLKLGANLKQRKKKYYCD